MGYKVNFRVIGDKPPFVVTLHEDDITNPAVLTKTVTTSNIIQSFVDGDGYIISPFKEYCVKAVDSINNNVSICDVDYPQFNLSVLSNQSVINVKYLNIDVNIFNNKSYNVPQLENVLLTTTPPQGYTFKNWETTPNTILNNSTDNPLNFSMLNTNFSIKPINEDNSNAFIFTIDTTLGTGSSFNLPLRSGYNYDFVVDWGDGNTNTVTSFDDVNKTHTYATGGEYQISITGLCESWYFNNGGDKLKLISIDQWGNTGFRNMQNAFMGCTNLTSIYDNNNTWSSNVVDMSGMFFQCGNLTYVNINNWDVSNVTNMREVFYGCSSLKTLDVSNWDVSNVNTMYRMFQDCSSLKTLDVSNWDVSNVYLMYGMFWSCSSLTTLDVSSWNVRNVTRDNGMGSVFQGCSSLTTLDVSNWDVSKVTNMEGMFQNTPLDTPSYDALLIGWSQLPSVQSNVEFHANLAKYSRGAAADARQYFINRYGWTISDAGHVV